MYHTKEPDIWANVPKCSEKNRYIIISVKAPYVSGKGHYVFQKQEDVL